MAHHEYTADHHRLAFMYWLETGSFTKASKKKGMPSVPTLSLWSKPGYKCTHGCSYHGWDKLKKAGDDGRTPEQLTVKALPVQESQPHLTDKEVILARRKEQLHLRIRGTRRDAVHRTLLPKYETSPDVLDADWKVRNRWLLEATSLNDIAGAIGERLASYEVTAASRWSLVNMLEGIIKECISRPRVDEEGNQRPINADDMREIASVVYYMRNLLNDIDTVTDKGVRAAISLGVKIKFGPPENEDDFIDVGGEEIGLIEFLDSILDAVPAEHRDMLFLAFEQAMHTPKGGPGPSTN